MISGLNNNLSFNGNLQVFTESTRPDITAMVKGRLNNLKQLAQTLDTDDIVKVIIKDKDLEVKYIPSWLDAAKKTIMGKETSIITRNLDDFLNAKEVDLFKNFFTQVKKQILTTGEQFRQGQIKALRKL